MAAQHSLKHHLMFAALATALFAAVPAFAQDAPDDTTTADASITSDRLVDTYAGTLFAGDEAAAGIAITSLRTGEDLTATITVQDTNADGTPKVDANGNPVMVTKEVVYENPNGPMGWGEVDHSLGIAQALIDSGQYASLEDALYGTDTADGILAMRADGMGWGQIAKELGFKSLGEVKSGRAATTTAVASAAVAKGKPVDRGVARADVVKAVRPEKPDRVAKVERPERPERPEKPMKPERGRP